MFTAITSLECPKCGRHYSTDLPAGICVCGSPLLARYELSVAEEAVHLDIFPTKVNSMWRYSLLLPVKSPSCIFTLGEGWTPLLNAPHLGAKLGLRTLRIKDETSNPTGSFKDRGLSVAVSKHVELGHNKFAMPTAGNAGVSLSAYAARSGTKATIFMPEDTPRIFHHDCTRYGAEVILVPGTISDSRTEMLNRGENWKDLSTTREPYRVEGKKTLGFEIAEQLEWEMPDVIVCPTGGGTAIIGIWKAIQELQAIGLVSERKPRLIAAQSEHCAPVVKAVEKKLSTVEPWEDPRTEALGLRVPSPFAGGLILKAIRNTNGSAVAVAETDIAEAQRLAAVLEGINLGPEPAVGLAGIRNLVEAGQIGPDEEVVLLNTGSDARYFI